MDFSARLGNRRRRVHRRERRRPGRATAQKSAAKTAQIIALVCAQRFGPDAEFGMYPFLLKLYADGGYQGPLFRRAVTKIMTQVNVEIVRRTVRRIKVLAIIPWWPVSSAD